MIPALFVFAYLAVVLYVGIFAFRRSARGQSAEDYFLASRSLGTAVFLFSLFGTNMHAFQSKLRSAQIPKFSNEFLNRTLASHSPLLDQKDNTRWLAG